VKHTLAILSALLLAPPVALHADDVGAKRPNVLFVVFDDLGEYSFGLQASSER
jgi:hypothetical protein